MPDTEPIQQPIERFRLRDVQAEGHALRDRLHKWLEPQHDRLLTHHATLPEQLDDRAQDVWEALLAVDELAGWGKATAAAIALMTDQERGDDSLTATLIQDISTVFAEFKDEPLRTSTLLFGLYAIEESPWGDWHGKPLTAQGLSRLLRPYRVRTMAVRADGQVVRGYKVEQFDEAFEQLGVLGVTGVTRVTRKARSQNACNAVTPENQGTRTGVEMPTSGEWLARDGKWRSVADEPPHWPDEIVETRSNTPSLGDDFDEEEMF
jgi:hypothetical protein